MGTAKKVANENYDRGITPAETAARHEREGEGYKHTPQQEGDIDTTSGYTVDKEGLANNYAIEPEMYVEEPGDLKAKQEAEAAEHAKERKEINQTDEEGKLTMAEDQRSKGAGKI